MCRLGAALGAQPETFMGMAGLGDLVLTCTDNQSRNRRFGLALGQGKTVDSAQVEIGQVVEGYRNTKEVWVLAQRYEVEMLSPSRSTKYFIKIKMLVKQPKIC